jgi:hypothetical protein
MRGYLLVILIIVAMMGGYLALLPLAGSWSNANTGQPGVGPF